MRGHARTSRHMPSVIVHYQEIALKGRNRPWFVERLVSNIRTATADLRGVKVRALMGRIELQHASDDDWAEVRERLARLPGIANFSRAVRTRCDIDAIADTVLGGLIDREPESFRVTAKRADKRFPLTSPQIERELGGRIKSARGWRVDLERPELTVGVEILNKDEAFCYVRKEPGDGGLPSGVSGRVACLLSGGIDSPVAAYRMIKRGCRVRLIHFHSYPILSHASQEKVAEIAERLTRRQLETRLYVVAFGDIQRTVVLAVPPPLRVVVYRRLMLQIAERIGRASGAGALVTGQHGGYRLGRDHAGAAPSGRDGQGRDRAGGPAPGYVSGIDRAGRGLLHPVHAEAPGNTGGCASGRRSGGGAGRGGGGDSRVARPSVSSAGGVTRGCTETGDVRFRYRQFPSFHNVSPFMNHAQPKAHNASDSSQNTGLIDATDVFLRKAKLA